MVDDLQGKYLATELNPAVLAYPFKIQTNWHVITGAACSGKTTLIDQIAEHGFLTAEECAREYFEVEMAKGRTSEEIRDAGLITQQTIFEMQQELEDRFSPAEVVFLDRGLPDSLTFYRVFGLTPDDLLIDCLKHCYASVFILDRLPFEREFKLGPEDERTAQFLDHWLERDYAALGYHVVRVPVIPIRERLAFVLDRLPGNDT
jgi:predicted ATPase